MDGDTLIFLDVRTAVLNDTLEDVSGWRLAVIQTGSLTMPPSPRPRWPLAPRSLTATPRYLGPRSSHRRGARSFGRGAMSAESPRSSHHPQWGLGSRRFDVEFSVEKRCAVVELR
jgi:hypothetical protein